MSFKKLFILVILTSIFLTVPNRTFAQQAATLLQGQGSLGVAKIIEIKEKDVKDGSIISAEREGPKLTTLAYDPQVIGVVARDAAVVINTSGIEKGIPIISTGSVYILVSTKDGKIKKGDMLASSSVPGVATKATKEGYILGTALEDYDNPNPKQVDKIAADLNLHYFNSKPTFPGSLTDIFKLALLPTKDSPNAIFKYVVAAIVVLGSFVLGFLSFGRTAAKGVEALGRNPAASKIIHLGIILNVGIVAVIVLSGLTVAFLILRL